MEVTVIHSLFTRGHCRKIALLSRARQWRLLHFAVFEAELCTGRILRYSKRVSPQHACKVERSQRAGLTDDEEGCFVPANCGYPKFITENICDIPDKPNIELMQQNIRDYKRHELLAQRQQEKLDALQQISRLYQEMNQAIDRCQIQKFLVRWAEKEAAQTEIDQRELERTECKENLANVNEQREELERQIEQKETRRSELELAYRQSNVSRRKSVCSTRKRL